MGRHDPAELQPRLRGAHVRAAVEREASKRYRERERAAMLAIAIEVLGDASAHPGEHTLARQRLTGRDLDDVEVDHLSAPELATLDALLDKVRDGTTGEVDLRVVAEPRQYEPIIAACATCKARRDADWINVDGLDDDTREALREAVKELLHETQDRRIDP